MIIIRLFDALCYVVAALLLGLGVVTMVNPLGRKLYLIDIFSLPVLMGALVCTLVFLLLRRRVPFLASLIGCILMMLSLLPTALPTSPKGKVSNDSVRLIFANLWVNNKTPEKLAEWVVNADPDIVAYIEDGPVAEERLMPLMKARYKYHFETWDSHVFSKYPLENATGYVDHHNLHRVDVLTPHKRMTLVLVHFTRPWPFTDPKGQIVQRDYLKSHLAAEATPDTIIVGDFNAAPHTALLQNLMADSRLSVAPSLGGTWPARLPAPLRVNIDNVLAGKGFKLSRKVIGSYYGSDHLPVMVEITPVDAS